MAEPSVLLGIVTRNRAEILGKAITSALQQRGANLRVCVLNDGGTEEMDSLTGKFPGVQWIKWEENRGYIEARNFLMQSAAADYFVSLDDDAWFLRGDEIESAVHYLEKNPTAGAVAFDILSPDHPNPRPREQPKAVAMFIGCGHVLRLSMARDLKFYQASPGLYGGEEKDFCLRLLDAGYKTILLPGVHVWHDKTAVERHTPAQHRSGVCNDLAMTLRRTPAWLLPLAMISKFYRHLVFSIRHKLVTPCLQGFALFFRSLGPIWRSRGPVKTSALRMFLRLRPQ